MALSRNALIWLAAAFSMAALIARTTDAVFHPQLMAEDGYAFFAQQRTLGAAAVLIPWQGQLYLLQRLVALVLSPLPTVAIPTAYLIAALLVSGWAAVTIASCEHRYAPVFAGLLFLVPHSGECFATLTNVHWILTIALAIILLTPPPTSRVARCNQDALAISAAFSGPGVVILAPVALWRAYQHRDAHSLILVGAVALGAMTQLGIATQQPALSYVDGHGDRPVHLLAAMVERTFGVTSMPVDTSVPVASLAIAAVVLIVALSAVWQRTDRALLLGMWFLCAGEIAATYARLYHASGMADYPWIWDRYYYIPRYVLMLSLACAVLQLRPVRSIAAALCLILFVALRPAFMWEKEAVEHLSWAKEAAQMDRGEATEVQINSGQRTPPSTLKIPAR